MKPLKILTEASGSLSSRYIANAIKEAGHIACGSDIDDFNAAAHICDDFIVMPKASDKNLWEKTFNLLKQHKIDIVLPSLDESLFGWSKHKAALAKEGITVLVSPPQTIATFLDKWATYQFFTQHNIPTPKTTLYQNYGVLKPRFGRGGSGIEFAESARFYADSLPDFVSEIEGGGGRKAAKYSQPKSQHSANTAPNKTDSNLPTNNQESSLYITQEPICAQEYTIDCLFDNKGNPIYIIPRKRLGVQSGKSTKGEVCYVESLQTAIQTIATHIALQGAINFQAFVDENGAPMFIEVNPRLGSGSVLSFAASENWIPLMIENLVFGKPIAPKTIRYGLKMARSYTEIFF